MVCRYFLITLLYSTQLLADSPKKETSLFLEYERVTSREMDSIQEEENPFKKIIHTMTPVKPKTPFVHVPVAPVIVSAPVSPKKPPIGHDDLPYLVINKPVDTTSNTATICPDPISLTVDAQTEEKPKKSLFSNLSSAKERVLAKAKEFLGTPYGYGNKETTQTDCSGFTQQVYKQFGVSLPRSAAEQATFGKEVASNDLQEGDLLFFQTYKRGPSHVGIYVGDGQMIHASSVAKRVQFDSIDKNYYKQRFIFAKRIALKSNNDTSYE